MKEACCCLGFSKDHRPEPGQVKISLASLDPLGMPLMTAVFSGDSADEPLYVPAICEVQKGLGAGGKLYVGDTKMGTLATRAALCPSQDYYLCPLGRKQMSESDFQQLVDRFLYEEVLVEEVFKDKELIAVGYKSSRKMSRQVKGYRVEWEELLLVVRSERYALSEKERLEKRIVRATARDREVESKKTR